MYSYQMIGIADGNNRVYESKYGNYSKKYGFELSELSKSMTKEELLNKLFHEDCWSLKKDIKKMTKDEIQKALGYEIEIIGNDECCEKNNTKVEDLTNYDDPVEEFLNILKKCAHL